MRKFPKPIVVVSRCLEFAACRYDGQRIVDDLVRQLSPFVKFMTVCPELEIGLGVPRDPIRIVEGEGGHRLLQPSTGKDLTHKMNRFANQYLNGLGQVDGFILKSRSPSCGRKDVKVFGDVESPVARDKGTGFFGQAVMNRFEGLAIEDEARLADDSLREHFLTHLFTMAAFRKLKQNPSMAHLAKFQAENKLLLMAYNQKAMRLMERIVANRERNHASIVCEKYEQHLKRVFKHRPRSNSNINVLQHAVGFFSDKIKPSERKHFLELLENYRKHRLPLCALQSVIEALFFRFDETYLAEQTYFQPYPRELRVLFNSVKGFES